MSGVHVLIFTMLHYFILVVITLIDSHKAGHHDTSNLEGENSKMNNNYRCHKCQKRMTFVSSCCICLVSSPGSPIFSMHARKVKKNPKNERGLGMRLAFASVMYWLLTSTDYGY